MRITEYKRLLTAKAKELRQSHVSKDEIAIERSAEPLDNIQQKADRELALESLTRNWRTASLVNGALERITSRHFGICEECGEPISERRLKALPWAQFCIVCQELHDQKKTSQPAEFLKAA